MLAGGYSWRLFFYVEAAFAATLLIMAFFFVEESTYHRVNQPISPHDSSQSVAVKNGEKEKSSPEELEHVTSVGMPPRKSFLSTLAPWSAIDTDAEFLMTMLRSFTYFLVPAVFWVIASYGILMATSTLTRIHANRISRSLHWPWSPGLQLHLPNQDCRVTI
jgi:hypothetical protein